jgi:hypothetical protein
LKEESDNVIQIDMTFWKYKDELVKAVERTMKELKIDKETTHEVVHPKFPKIHIPSKSPSKVHSISIPKIKTLLVHQPPKIE